MALFANIKNKPGTETMFRIKCDTPSKGTFFVCLSAFSREDAVSKLISKGIPVDKDEFRKI